VSEENGLSVLQSPDGYKFFIVSENVSGGKTDHDDDDDDDDDDD
jgi:hypothetical protein